MLSIRRVAEGDDLAAICQQMQPELWDSVNDMSSYSVEKLQRFLGQNGILLLAYEGDKIAGAALCYDLPHPGGEHTLYVHELDTHPDFRRQGVATQLMNETFKIGKEIGADEVWLSTETDNDPANALYKKLNPTEIEQSITYAYKVQ